MLVTLLILIIATLLGAGLGSLRQVPPALARWVILLGVVAALGVHLYNQGISGGGMSGYTVEVPSFAPWLSAPAFRVDTLSSGLGAWCLLLAALVIVAQVSRDEPRLTERVVLYSLAAAALYSMVHTFDLLVFAGQVLLLAVIVWALAGLHFESEGTQAEVAPLDHNSHSMLALGLGAVCLLGGVLALGRTTGGHYSLLDLSLSPLSGWPLIMIAVWAALWLGLAPFTAWSSRASRGHAGLVQALIVLVPAATLLLRLQALVSAQGLAGSVPGGWPVFTALLAWLGGITAIAASAGAIIWAGTNRFSALLTASTGGLIAWAFGFDNPSGRQAALVLLVAFGAARVALELLELPSLYSWPGAPDTLHSHFLPAARAVAVLSTACAPLTPGFVGVWLLGANTIPTRHAALVMALAAVVILSTAGAALHMARIARSTAATTLRSFPWSGLTTLLGILGGAALLVGGMAPALWMRQATALSSVAGGSPAVETPWPGISASGGIAPLLLLGITGVALVLVGWLLGAALRRGVSGAGLLLPAAMGRAGDRASGPTRDFLVPAGHETAPSPVWWVSLEWIDEGVWGFGRLLLRLATRFGIGLERLESRYYLPLAVLFALVALFAITR